MTLGVGIVGTGYAARKRVEALKSDSRARIVAVAGRDPVRSHQFGQTHGLTVAETWQALVQADAVDLVIISTVNALHGPIAQAALTARKHVVVEYPLALDLAQAETLIQLAATHQRLLHVEHIERLGGLHQTTAAHLDQIGQPHYVNYRTLNPRRPAPQTWSYDVALSGFPLMAALSRIHRLTHLFGPVSQVFCQSHWQPENPTTARGTYHTCLCGAQLQFQSGLWAEVTYGKGEHLWAYSRRMEIQGSRGALIFDRDQGVLITEQGEHSLVVEPRQGLFAKDTSAVLNHLIEGASLYISPAESLYALKVADALRRSADTGMPLVLA
jgi:biliverdin reductase